MTQQIYLSPRDTQEWPWHIRPEVLEAVDNLKRDRGENFTLIDIGASHNPFDRRYLTHTFDILPAPKDGVHEFIGNMNKYEDWQPLLDHVQQHGKFTFVNCTHTLEDLANPMLVLDMLPRIAEQPADHGYLTEALISSIAQAAPEAKARVKAFLEGKAAKVQKS